MNILVTDGNSKAALAITRSLGEKGHCIYVAANTVSSLASCSRYCHKALMYPDPSLDSAGFQKKIQQLVTENSIDILMPVADICVFPVAEITGVLGNECHVPIPPVDALRQAADKSGLLDMAERLDVPIPESVVVNHFDDFDFNQIRLEYPLVIKPARSRVKSGAGWINTSVDYAETPEELQGKLSAIPGVAYPVVLQERIIGNGIGIFYCFRNGEPVASFAHRRIREKPPSGGVSVLCESTPLHPQAHEFGLKLLRYLGWHGVAMVEFKVDGRDKTPKLIEINGRFWGSLQLAINSGVDFPDLLVQIADGKTPEYSGTFRTGIRSRWLWGEIDLLLMHLLKKRESLRLPPGYDNRLLSILKILSPYVRDQNFDVLRLSDFKPWLCETINRLRV